MRKTCGQCRHYQAGQNRRSPAQGSCDIGYKSCRTRSSAACRCGFEPSEPTPPTRADAVRAMSDEQLADAILDIPTLSDYINFCLRADCEEAEKGECWDNGACRACLIAWLRGPANVSGGILY